MRPLFLLSKQVNNDSMISAKCKYAIRSILYLAGHKDEQQKTTLSALANALQIPAPYLAKVLQEIVPKKLISAVKGPRGGFFLTASQRQIPCYKSLKALMAPMFSKNVGWDFPNVQTRLLAPCMQTLG